MKTILTLTFALTLSTCLAAPRKVKVSNASDTTLKVCIYSSISPDDLGIAAGEFRDLARGTNYTYEYRFQNGNFIHAVVFNKNGDTIVTSTHQASNSDSREITINITQPTQKAVNRAEIERMKTLVNDETTNFSVGKTHVINVDGDANTGIQEYLGAIVILDTAESDNSKKIKMIYTARQLSISENPPLSGRSFKESYKISKDYAGEASVNIPAAFSSNIDFSRGELQEVSLACKSIGSILLPTRPGVTPVGVLIDFDEKSATNIVGTITSMLDQCETCALKQVNSILAHGGIAVNVKRYKKSKVAFQVSGASVVTTTGTYNYENGFDYFDIISPRVIALGFTGVDLKSSFANTIVDNLKGEKRELERLIGNQQLSIASLRSDLQEVESTIAILESFAGQD